MIQKLILFAAAGLLFLVHGAKTAPNLFETDADLQAPHDEAKAGLEKDRALSVSEDSGRMERHHLHPAAAAEGHKMRRISNTSGRVDSIDLNTHPFDKKTSSLLVEAIRQGRIGKLLYVENQLGDSPLQQSPKITEPPSTIDYQMWLGQAPEQPYSEVRVSGHFRFIQDYASVAPANSLSSEPI